MTTRHETKEEYAMHTGLPYPPRNDSENIALQCKDNPKAEVIPTELLDDILHAEGRADEMGSIQFTKTVRRCVLCDLPSPLCSCERLPGGIIKVKDNPKAGRAVRDGKAPLDYIPLETLEGTARVLESGAKKYGKRNWRVDKIKSSTYQAAFLRHLTAYYAGETNDPDTGENHLSHIMANCMVMLDATLAGTLIDDRDEKESL